MKKGIFLIFFLLFLSSGCYDYEEINNMAIVSAVSVDYEDDEFHVAFEILNTKSKEDNQNSKKVYLSKGSGSAISQAFSAATLEIAKSPYLAHLKTVIIDEEIAKNHLEEIVDFFLRDNHIRNIFYLVLAKDTTAFEILNHTDENNPVMGTAISDLIENTAFTNNIASQLNYEKFLINIIDPRKDTYITSLEIQDNLLKLGPIGIFHKYELQTYFTEDESAVFNLMNGTSKEIHFKINCPNEKDAEKFIILSTFSSPKSGIEINNNTAKVSTEVETRIIENHCEVDFKKVETYEEIQKQLEEKIKKDMQEVIDKLLLYKSDVLKIEEAYYQKYKTEIDFTKLQYNYDAKVIINRNGLIFEVKQ